MNMGEFGSLATLTSLPQVQQAVLLINEADLLTIANVLGNGTEVQDVARDGLLLTNLIYFIQTVEQLAPIVGDIRAVVSYIILEQLGLTVPGL